MTEGMEFEHQGINKEEQTEKWRLETLMAAGWPVEFAEPLAANKDIDLHEAVRRYKELDEKGAPASLIFDEVWPIDQEKPKVRELEARQAE